MTHIILKKIYKLYLSIIFKIWDLFNNNKTNFNWNFINKVLIFRLDRMGDFIATIPMISALKQSYPKIKIDILTTKYTSDLANNVEGINQVFIHPNDTKKLKNKYNLIIDPHFSPYLRYIKYAFLSFSLKGHFRLGYNIGIKAIFYNIRAKITHAKRYEVERNLDLIRSIGITRNSQEYLFKKNTSAQNKVQKFLKEHNINSDDLIVGCHIGAYNGQANRCWPEKNFANLADLLWDKLKIKTIFTGSSSEKHKIELIQNHLKNNAIFAVDELNTIELKELMKYFNAFVSSFTGPLFLAEAVGCPAVILNGPTPLWRWEPQKIKHTIVQSNLDCVPCNDSDVCYRGDNACMTKIKVENVFDEIQKLLIKNIK